MVVDHFSLHFETFQWKEHKGIYTAVVYTFELGVLVFEFHGFVTGLESEPQTTLSAYNNMVK